MEDIMEPPHASENSYNIWPRPNSCKVIQIKWNQQVRELFVPPCTYCSSIHNAWGIESTQVSINWWLDEENEKLSGFSFRRYPYFDSFSYPSSCPFKGLWLSFPTGFPVSFLVLLRRWSDAINSIYFTFPLQPAGNFLSSAD